MEFILKKILLVGVLLFGAVSTASASMLPSMQESEAYTACMKVVNDQWKGEQKRFEDMSKFQAGLQALEKQGFSQTSQCFKAFSQIGASGSFSIPGVSEVLDQLKNGVDEAMAGQCQIAFDKLNSALNDATKGVDFQSLEKYGVKAKFKLGRK